MKKFLAAAALCAFFTGAPTEGAAAQRAAEVAVSPVNINTASPEELESLPGIGKVTARKIVVHRIQNGKFSAPDDLVKVKGIGPKTLEKLRGKVVVK